MSNSKICDICDKEFPNPAKLKAHKNRKIPCTSSPKECEYCGKKFARQSGVTRHLKDNVCLQEKEEKYKEKTKENEIREEEKKKLEKKMELINEQKQLIDEQMKELLNKQTITVQNINGNQINNNNNNTQNTVNFLTKEYIVKNFNNDPCLKELDNYDDIRAGNMITDPHYDDENIMFINTIVSQHNLGKLIDYLSKIIISFYKNPNNFSLQPIWCSDTSRMNFLVRVLPCGSKCNKWVTDSSGIMIKEKVIKPLLNYVVKCADEYRLKYAHKMIKETDKFLTLSEIVSQVSNNALTDNIAKYIAPHFTLGKQLSLKA
jgi:hypothetical protein